MIHNFPKCELDQASQSEISDFFMILGFCVKLWKNLGDFMGKSLDF